jgi:putative nucleotidyltransferase with HDIG domain
MPHADSSLIQHIKSLPALPSIASELLAIIDQDNADVAALARRIASDQALAAKTLQLANSPFYGMANRVATIQQAITVLGVYCIRNVVTACAVTSGWSAASNAVDIPAFWRHSILTAASARNLARALRQDAELAFMAGLLHDLGALVLATGFPGQYAELVRIGDADQQRQAERERFGFDHTEAGSALAAQWNFPEAIQAAVRSHHEPAMSERGIPQLVRVANQLAHALAENDTAACKDAVAELGLSDAQCERVVEQTREAFQDLCRALIG